MAHPSQSSPVAVTPSTKRVYCLGGSLSMTCRFDGYLLQKSRFGFPFKMLSAAVLPRSVWGCF